MAKRIVGRHVCCWVEHMDSDWQTSFDQKYVWSNRRERRWRWPAFARTQFPSCPPSRDDKDFINRPNAMGPWPDVSAKPTRSIACNRGLGQQTNLWWFHQMKTTSDLRNDWFLMNVCLMFLFLFSFYLSLLPVLHLLLGLRVWCDVRLCVCGTGNCEKEITRRLLLHLYTSWLLLAIFWLFPYDGRRSERSRRGGDDGSEEVV